MSAGDSLDFTHRRVPPIAFVVGRAEESSNVTQPQPNLQHLRQRRRGRNWTDAENERKIYILRVFATSRPTQVVHVFIRCARPIHADKIQTTILRQSIRFPLGLASQTSAEFVAGTKEKR